MENTKNNTLFYVSLVCAIWFAFTGMVWVYLAALVVAYPVGLVSFVLWRLIRHENRKRTKLIPVILLTGLVLSLLTLVYLLIWDN